MGWGRCSPWSFPVQPLSHTRRATVLAVWITNRQSYRQFHSLGVQFMTNLAGLTPLTNVQTSCLAQTLMLEPFAGKRPSKHELFDRFQWPRPHQEDGTGTFALAFRVVSASAIFFLIRSRAAFRAARALPRLPSDHPNVRMYASMPRSRNSISNLRSSIGFGCRISW
jgi:hypothetical protein